MKRRAKKESGASGSRSAAASRPSGWSEGNADGAGGQRLGDYPVLERRFERRSPILRSLYGCVAQATRSSVSVSGAVIVSKRMPCRRSRSTTSVCSCGTRHALQRHRLGRLLPDDRHAPGHRFARPALFHPARRGRAVSFECDAVEIVGPAERFGGRPPAREHPRRPTGAVGRLCLGAAPRPWPPSAAPLPTAHRCPAPAGGRASACGSRPARSARR